MLGSASTAVYDEIHVGNTYSDVAPLSVSSPAAPTLTSAGVVPVKASTVANSAGDPLGSVLDAGYSNTSNEIDLTWTDGSQANPQQGVYIEQSSAGTTWAVIEKIVDPAAVVTSYSVTNLSADTQYAFRVGSYNSANNSSSGANYSSSFSATTDDTPPAAPGNLTVTSSNGAQVTANWTDATGTTGYVLQYADSRGSDNSLIWNSTGTQGASVTSYTFTVGTSSGDINPNSVYYFRVIGYNNGGNSPISNVVSQVAFAAPTSVAAQGIGASQVSLAWSDPVLGATGYNVEYSTNGINGWTTLTGIASAGAIQGNATGLNPDTEYYFQVQAYDATGSFGAGLRRLKGERLTSMPRPWLMKDSTIPYRPPTTPSSIPRRSPARLEASAGPAPGA